MRRLGVITAGAALALAACGDGGGEDAVGLAGMLPADRAGTVVFADFAAAREAAGLPEDADFRLARTEGGTAGRRFEQEASVALRPATPLTEALDSGQIEAAATDGRVTLIRTDQDAEEISAAAGEGGPIGVVEGEDGLIGIGSDRELVERVLAGEETEEEDEDGTVREALIEELGGLPVGFVRVEATPRSCVSGVAIGDEIEDGGGVLVLSIEGSVDPAGFLLSDAPGVPGLSPYAVFEFGEPEADGDLLRVPFTYPLEEAGAPLALGEAAVLAEQSFYACAGTGAD